MARIKKKLFRLELAMAAALIICICGAVWPVEQTCASIQSKVLRLHILAHSDSAIDQSLKLQVRDLVLADTASLFTQAESRAEAEAAILQMMPQLEDRAEALLRSAGYPYQVHGELTDMYFTARTYDSGTMPAGTYRAVRLTIGSGLGKNWWCVMFPPMCLSAAVSESDDASGSADDILTPDETDLITHPEHYRIRLKIVEWWQQLRAWAASD